MSFEKFALSDEILKSLKALGYTNPTEVQDKVLDIALNNKDIVVKSQTGSGKTASFAIPVCENINWDENRPQALILTPTRELAVQVSDDFTSIGRFKRLKSLPVFGKQPITMQINNLKQKTHIVVGTPGRVMDLINKGALNLDKVKYLVIDEADEMLNMGFIDQVEEIINCVPHKRVTMLFSATISEEIQNLATRYMRNFETIEIKAKGLTTEKIEHRVYEVNDDAKYKLLRDLTTVENPDTCMIFCRTKENVDMLFNKLRDSQYPCFKIHGGMNQSERLSVMKDFRLGKFMYLIATDVAARGIDIDNVTHVINYDIPLEKESYVHRSGRTARAGKSGVAITFVNKYEKRFLDSIEEYIGFKIDIFERPENTVVVNAKDKFKEKLVSAPKAKKEKGHELNKDIMKLYFNGGKKKKLRALDFVGTISSIDGVTGDDIGIIEIQDICTYIDILNGKGKKVLSAMKEKTIKGKKLKVDRAYNK